MSDQVLILVYYSGGELQPRDAHQVLRRDLLREGKPQQGNPQGEHSPRDGSFCFNVQSTCLSVDQPGLVLVGPCRLRQDRTKNEVLVGIACCSGGFSRLPVEYAATSYLQSYTKEILILKCSKILYSSCTPNLIRKIFQIEMKTRSLKINNAFAHVC